METIVVEPLLGQKEAPRDIPIASAGQGNTDPILQLFGPMVGPLMPYLGAC